MIRGSGKTAPFTSSRSGLVSVAVLIALIIVAIVCASLIKVGIARRAEVVAEERRLQADWLVESGLDRAWARLSASDAYPGESWDLPGEDFGGRGRGHVVIKVEPVPDRAGARRVTVHAEYPAGATLRAARSRAIVMEFPQSPR